MTWQPGTPHPKPDPNRCPHCGAEGSFRELAKRFTWQPVTLAYDEDWADEHHTHVGTGALIEADYESFDYGDDTEVTGIECQECGAEWPELGVLAYWQRVRQALEDWRDYHYAQAARAEGLDASFENAEELAGTAAAEAFEQALAILTGNGEA